VQTLVSGPVGGTLLLYRRGKLLWWHNSLRVRFWPEPYGPSAQRRSVSHPAFAAVYEKLGAMLAPTGLFEVEWIMPEGGGPPVLIELNPRPPSFTYLAEEMGADLPGAIRAMLAGDETARPPVEGPEGPVVRLFPEDAIRAAESLDWMDLALWLTGAAGPLPWRDDSLLRAYGWRVTKGFVRALIPSARRRPR
jgi:hypothetical protein